MIIRNFLDWSRNASTDDRALAVGILAEIYLTGDLSDEDRRHAEAALTLVLDDTAIIVRKTLAEILAGSARVPRHIIIGLLQDHEDVASLVVANSPMLRESELIACLGYESTAIQIAVAQRNHVSPTLAAAIADCADITAVYAMLENAGAEIAGSSIHRLLERFNDEAVLREILINRSDLPVDIRMSLVDATSRHLVGFAKGCGWLSPQRAARLQLETTETGSLAVANDVGESEIVEVALRLRQTGQLTPQLLLRSLLSGDTRLFAAALADLSGVSWDKANGFVHGNSISGFRALYRKAKMPETIMPAFEAALAAWHEYGAAWGSDHPRLSLRMVEQVLTAVAVFDQADETGLLELLGRFHAEAAREDAKERIAAIMAVKDSPEEDAPLTIDPDAIDRQLAEALEMEFSKAA